MYSYIGLHVKYPLFLSDFNETLIFLTDFRKYSDIKFHETSPNGTQAVLRGQTDGRTDGRTYRHDNFANAPKKCFVQPAIPHDSSLLQIVITKVWGLLEMNTGIKKTKEE